MSNIVIELRDKNLITPPTWLPNNVQYLTIMGSHAYGVADTAVRAKLPDYDVYGFGIPPKSMLFPHLDGHVPGFGPEPQGFDQYQQHHIMDAEANAGHGKEWDLQVFNIVKYFELCRQNNPNMIDSLFTPENCVIHCTQVGRLVRDNRKMFLSKEAWKKFRGYAFAQLKKAESAIRSPQIQAIWAFEDEHSIPRSTTLKQAASLVTEPFRPDGFHHLSSQEVAEYVRLYTAGMNESQRFENRKCQEQDSKFLYHILRLFDEAEQILLEGDIDLQRAKEAMKAIRRGDWKMEEIERWTVDKERALEVAYTNCKLPEHAPIEPLKKLLLQCLEHHYGSLDNCITQVDWAETALKDIERVLESVRLQLHR